MRKPLVAIAVPSYCRWHPATGISIVGMCIKAAHAGYSITTMSYSKSPAATARNQLVRFAQQARADFILFLDDDMVFPRETLERLVAHDKDIVGVIASTRVPPYRAIGDLIEPDGSSLCVASQLGAGVLLIRMSVFDRVPAPWFKHQWGAEKITAENPDGELSEDLYFCREARKSGVEVWCDRDLSLEIGHVGDHILSVEKDQQIGGAGSPFVLSKKQGWKQ